MDEVARAKAEFAKVSTKFRFHNKNMEKAAKAIFPLYKNLLGKSALIKWNKIVANQIGTSLWTNLNGHTNDTIHKKMIKSFKNCVKFHLLTIFPQDAAEWQKYYIKVHLKKSAKVTIHHFANHVEQLKSYLGHLPGLLTVPRHFL